MKTTSSPARARAFLTACVAVWALGCGGDRAATRPPVVPAPPADVADAGAGLDVADASPPDDAPVDGVVAATPGQPLEPLADLPVELAELVEVQTRDDGLVVGCAARTGLALVDARDPAAPRAYPHVDISVPGVPLFRCTHVALSGSLAYVTFRADGTMPSLLAALDLSSPAAPSVVAAHSPAPGVVFEASAALGDLVAVAMHRDGVGVFERQGGTFALRATVRGLVNAHGVALAGATLYVADGEGGLATVDVSDPRAPRVLGRVATGGVAQSVAVEPGARAAYVGAGGVGVVVVDVSRRDAPALAGRVTLDGPAGQVAVSDGRLHVAAWRDLRAYGLGDPLRPSLVAVASPRHLTEIARVTGIAARGDTVAVADWDHLETWRMRPGRAAPYLESSPEPVSFGRVAAGAERSAYVPVENLGGARLAHAVARVSDPSVTVSPAEFSLDAGESVELRVTLRAREGGPTAAVLTLHADDPLVPDVTVSLTANPAALDAGDRAPDESVRLTDGAAWSLAAQRGHPVLLAYFTSWCPACAVEMPDVESRVWARYRERGLAVVGVDPPLSSFRPPDTLDDAAAFARSSGLTFPLGTSTTSAYDALRSDRGDGSAPFPLLVLVDRAGDLAYVGTTFDPDALARAIERVLAP